MQFTRSGNFISVVRITGPTHNLLQIQLGQLPQVQPMCEKWPAMGGCRHEPLDESKLVACVLEGAALANKQLRTKHSITHIRYVENDTKPESAYAYMCLKLIEHLESGGEFAVSTEGDESAL